MTDTASRALPRTISWQFILRVGLLAAASVLLPMLMVWFPRPLFDAAGTARLPCFIAVLAVLLGPLTVGLAARRGRPLARPAFRWMVAGQAVALAGCALALYVQRPVYLVFIVDRFDLVIARDIAPQDLAKGPGPFARRPLGPPEYVAAVAPPGSREAERITDAALGGGKDLQAYPQFYVPYTQQARNALGRAKPLAKLLERDDGTLKQYLESSGKSQESLRFLPLRGKKRDGAVLLDAVSGLPLQVLLIEPW